MENILLLLDGETETSLSELIKLNTDEIQGCYLENDEIEELKKMSVGDSFYIGICHIKRIS